jgi:8-oxo-dGTP pyrophosphatase MutT (NUDIX family)
VTSRSASGPTLTRLARIEAGLEPWTWPWAERERARIADHWARRLAERPAMFDGPVLLARDYAVSDGVANLVLFEARFSQLLALRDFAPADAGVLNVFSAAAPRGRDGGYLLGLMAAHTANAGQLYFPCGTPDRSDARPDGSVDLAGSALRELAEETGLAEAAGPTGTAGPADAPWTAIRDGELLGFLRTVRLDLDVEAARARALAHLAAEAESELADLVIVRGPADLDPRMPRYVRAFLAATFEADAPRA